MQRLEMQFKKLDNFRVSESYKVVRSNLMFLGSTTKAILFTSCVECEGKSTVSWNVARSLAESGKRVVYIDADMRKSVFTSRHKVRGAKVLGLSQFLSDQAILNDVICATEQENLYVITTGPFPPNPSELLSRSLFANAIKVLKSTFDYIIIDAPPITATTDPAVIASACDGSVMVVAAKKVSARVIRECIAQLDRTGTPVLGAILNMADSKYLTSGYGRYYGKYYGKYYGIPHKSDAEQRKDD